MLFLLSSFDLYDHTSITTNGVEYHNWLNESAGIDILVSTAYGRSTKSGLRLRTSSLTQGHRASVGYHLGGNYETVTVGLAFRLESTNSGVSRFLVDRSQDNIIFSLLDGWYPQISLVVRPSMRLGVRLGPSGGFIEEGDFFLKENVYYYIELEATISNVAGRLTLSVDGVQRFSVFPVDTQNSGNPYCNGLRLGGTPGIGQINAGRYQRYDHLYFLENSSGIYRAPLGDVHIEGIAPNGGGIAQWTPSAGSSYAAVNDDAPDTSDYTMAISPGPIDAYSHSSPTPVRGTVLAVGHNIYARKSRAGVVAIAPVTDYRGTTTVGTDLYLSQSWANYQYIDERNPTYGGTVAFTLGDFGFGGASFGMKRTI